MAFTRFHDDPCRIVKQNQQMTDQGRWVLNVPGNGDKPCYMMDPHIIPQKWGGNLWTNHIDIQNSLLGIDRKLTRGSCLNDYSSSLLKINSQPIKYPSCEILTTEQSRATHPAWMSKDLEQVNWYYLPKNPQENVFVPFQNNFSTRLSEKDNFVRKFDCNTPNGTGNYPSRPQLGKYVGGPITCASTNSCSKI